MAQTLDAPNDFLSTYIYSRGPGTADHTFDLSPRILTTFATAAR